jgi:hypothetical protein
MSSVRRVWSQKSEKAYIRDVIETKTREHSVIIDFSDGGHKRVERNVDTLGGVKTFRCRKMVEIAGLQAVAERHDSV